MTDPEIEFVSLEHRQRGTVRALFVNGMLKVVTTYDEPIDYEDVLTALDIKFENTDYDSMTESPSDVQAALRAWWKDE